MNEQNADQKSALIIATSYGVEADELLAPQRYLEGAGYAVTVATPDGEDIRTLVSDKDPGPTVPATSTLADVDVEGHAVLVVPGGTLNADSLRLDADALRLVKGFAEAGTPIAAICHGPWLAVEADLVEGRTLTSYASLRTDISNAGGSWVDEPVAVDDTGSFTLITSRTPEDLEQFTAAIGEHLA
ncbi:type 1 glutamine amidotransferase domain-containing protein [Brachybacterium rhamnosum]|uniref:DJ-1/PfpI family protein n=1 Tax=Brachybacterium rhamnosum TaxID=173361 RepID=A0ABW4PXC0_9MICO